MVIDRRFRSFPLWEFSGTVPGTPQRSDGMYDRSPEALAFYGSQRWKKCRAKYLKLHPICERCDKQGIITKADHVHHVVPLEVGTYNDPMVSLNFENLEALCFNCHNAEHHKNKDCRDGLFFDAAGNLRKG